ncbi:MAG: VOC family protein [Rickettsiaceae bacterium]|nr:VOC family protein [Rickettsiaceae bacterium]
MSFKPENFPQLSPYLTVTDADKLIKFYQDAFGFTTENVSKDDNGKPQHVEMRFGEAVIMFCPEGAFGTPNKAPITQNVTMPINLYIYCEDVDKLYQQAIDNEAKSTVEPQDGFWGDRFCMVMDPDGYEWGFATKL